MDSSLQFEWAPATESELDQLADSTMKRIRGTLSTSCGAIKEKAWTGNRSVEDQVHRWRDEFGEHGAEWIEK